MNKSDIRHTTVIF